MKITALLLFIVFLGGPMPAVACTSFYLKQGARAVHGANFDWPEGDGAIVINQRGVIKRAVTDPSKKLNPVGWTSKYGSVTFNSYGVDWPWGGMNEAGLACSTLMLAETEYPLPDARPSIFMGQWLQYQLDNCATVEDVLGSDALVRIRKSNNGLKAHYFFSDRQGRCAVVEFIKGKQVAYHAGSMPTKALTNDRYDRLLSNTKKFRGFGGSLPIPTGNLSLMRFLRTAQLLKDDAPQGRNSVVERAFAILDGAAYRLHPRIKTQWRIVFDTQNQSIWYRTGNRTEAKQINLKAFDFDCASKIMMVRIDYAADQAEVDRFAPFTHDANRTMVEKAFRLNPMKPSLNQARLDRVVGYPDTFICE